MPLRNGKSPSVWLHAYGDLVVYAGAPQLARKGGVPVAQKVQTLFIDDLDGSEAEGTVRFGLDGRLTAP